MASLPNDFHVADVGTPTTLGHSFGVLQRHVAAWDFTSTRDDELSLTRGDVLLVSKEFDDGWMQGMRLHDFEIGFFPKSFVVKDTSPIYKLKDIQFPTDHYLRDPKFLLHDSSKRSKIALEVYTSEGSYLAKLRLLDEKFATPLSTNGLVNPEEYGAIFGHIQVLINLSECLLVHLKSRMEGWDENRTIIGDVFLHLGHHMKIFTSYAIQHRLGAQLITKLGGQEKFRVWKEQAQVECRTALESLLIEPIQRIPRYELLLKDLIKHTSEEHADHPLLKDALLFIQKIARNCNDNVHRADNELKLYSISRRFPNDEVEILTSKKLTMSNESGKRRENGRIKSLSFSNMKPKNGSTGANGHVKNSLSFRNFFDIEHRRVFVREGTLIKTKSDFTDPMERYLFLCSDVLLIAQPITRSRKTFRLKEKVLLRHAWITDTLTMTERRVPERGLVVDTGLVLGTPLKVYYLFAQSAEEKALWFSDLHSLIFTQKRLFNKLLSHLSIPDERFLCATVKAKVHYIGMLSDELSFKAGDDVLVLGFRGREKKWQPGLYLQEAFNPSPEWYFGSHNGNFGWFPSQCLLGADTKPLEPPEDELQPARMSTVLDLKQRMTELTGREVPPLTEPERTVKVCMGEGNFKTLRILKHGCVDDIVRKYFKPRPDHSLHWSLIEQSLDGTVQRLLGDDEDPSKVVDFWGKSRDQMKFVLKQRLVLPMDESKA